MEKQKRDFKGIWIPREIYLAKELNRTERDLYVEIDSLSHNEKGCFASNQYLGNFLGCGEATIRNAISKLRKLGLVKQIGFDGRKRTLKTMPENIKKLTLRTLENLRSDNKKINPIYSNTDSNTDINKLSKDNIKSDDLKVNKKVFNSSFAEKVITYQNKLADEIEGLPHIRITKRNKTIQELELFIKLLRHNRFLTNKTINPICRRKNNIPLKDTIKFDYKKHLDSLSLLYKSEYEPKNKFILPKSFLELIYKPISKTSWLMQAMYNPPKLVANTIKVKDQYPEITKFFVNKLNGNVENTELRTKLVYGIKSIMEFQGKIPVKTLDVPKLNREFGDRLNLCKNYWEWLEQQDWIEEITSVCIRTKGKLWSMFVKEMEEDCDGYRLQ